MDDHEEIAGISPKSRPPLGLAESSLMNTAFITSVLLSEDSFYSCNSNSSGDEGPSTTFKTCSNVPSNKNEAFAGSGALLKRSLNERYCYIRGAIQRIMSLPSELETGDKIGIKSSDTDQKLFLEEPRKPRKMKSETDVIPQNFPEEYDEFDDSVFLETNHLAHKAANKLDEGFIWDSKQESVDFLTDVNEDELMKCDTDTVFKAEDEMLASVILPKSVKENAKLSCKNEINASSYHNKSTDPRRISNQQSGTHLKNKFKPRKVEAKLNFKRGPLKAVLPLSNMVRRKN